jgi:hypothetical protein
MGKRTVIAQGSGKKVEVETTEVQNEMDSSHDNRVNRFESKKQFTSLADRIAESHLFIRNYKFKEADKLYARNTHIDYRFVSKIYPHAKGGPLLVDEPRSEHQSIVAYEKQKELKKLGYRHIVIEENSTLYDCLKQLGEL